MKHYLKLYSKLPSFVQQFLFEYKARKDYKKRFSGAFGQYFVELKLLWQSSLPEIEKYQRDKVRLLLREAYLHSTWYQKKFNGFGISLEAIESDTLAVLKLLPFLEKNDLRYNLDTIVSNNPSINSGGVNYTSGTTGSPMKTIMSKESIQMGFALWKRFHYSIGLPLHPESIRFSGNQIISLTRKKPPFWAYNKFEKRLFFSIYHLRKEYLPMYIKKLDEFQPELLDGYPSGIYVLANYILNNKITLSFVPKAICTTAEPLTLLIREKIEEAFRCKVYNQYSSSEGGVFIAECTHSNLHVHLDSGYIEYYNEKGEVGKEGETCELIITGFRNFKTPLIRYKTGDWVELSSSNILCSCGSKMPVVNKILGRVEDYLVDEHGTEQGMVSYRTFKLASNIVKTQVVQTSRSNILVRIVKDLNYSKKDEHFIETKLHEILGKSMIVTFDYCVDIETGANGKFKTVVKEI